MKKIENKRERLGKWIPVGSNITETEKTIRDVGRDMVQKLVHIVGEEIQSIEHYGEATNIKDVDLTASYGALKDNVIITLRMAGFLSKYVYFYRTGSLEERFMKKTDSGADSILEF